MRCFRPCDAVASRLAGSGADRQPRHQSRCCQLRRFHRCLQAACERANLWVRALQLLRRGAGLEIDAVACNAAATACERAGHWPAALELLQASRLLSGSASLSLVACSVAASCWRAASSWAAAVQLLQEAQVVKVEVNVVVWGAVVSACERSGKWQPALELLTELRQQGLALNAVLCASALDACGKAALWQPALSILSQIRQQQRQQQQQQQQQHRSSGFTWGAASAKDSMLIACSSSVSACERSSQWERALALLELARLDGARPNVVLLAAAVSACGRGSGEEVLASKKKSDRGGSSVVARWTLALSLLRGMKEALLKPNEVIYAAAVSACEKGERWEASLVHQ
ncbi:unnamed protein product, partial [Polarella glacialis]